MNTIHVGFQIGNGDPVDIPLKHLAITGQTQEAGKTTALDALLQRSKRKGVVFLTKRGEGAFEDAQLVDPYFRDQGDWQFVAAILEASRREKLKFERSWIIRASRGAKRLADVQANIKEAMRTAKGLSADVYLTLDAYLDVVVPAIAHVKWAPKLVLDAPSGVNAIDLTTVPEEMQHLVIKSTLEWVQHFEKDTIVVIPEAWKFVPQGRNTPVKLAATAYIRQGAAMGNYLWLDSQDIGGVEKEILRNVAVWMIGVQREANEIKRTLDNIPKPKPSEKEIATLGIGEFYVCYRNHAIATYVQPVWAGELVARRYAMGHLPAPPAKPKRSEQVTDHEKQVLESKIAGLEQALKVRDDIIAKLERRLTDSRIAVTETQQRHANGDPVFGVPASAPPAPGNGGGPVMVGPFTDDLYQAIKARLIADAPALLRIVLSKPEIEVTVKRPVLDFDPDSLKGRIVKLMTHGFFIGENKSNNQIRTALKRIGPDANTANIGRSMDDFVKLGLFTDEGSGYRIVEGVAARVLEAD